MGYATGERRAGNGRGQRVTSADVARESGLSRATISYVLNNTPHQKIPEETRRRVLETAARLGYAPSAAARALRSGRSEVVLCLLPDWPMGQEVGAMLENLSTSLAEHGLTFVVHPRARGRRPISEIWKALTPAAVLAFEDFSESDAAAMRAAGVEQVVVLLGRSRQGRRELEVPQQRIGRLQVEHLAATGHRHIGYAYPDDARLRTFAVPRLDGARTACADLGIDDPVVQTVALDADSAAAAARRWCTAAPPVTGVCAYNDEIALAVLAGARALGLAVPGDLAVVGVDDIPAAWLTQPALTTIGTDQAVVAEHLSRTIVQIITGGPEPPRPGSDTIRVVRRESA
jgi:DNA-binding LacI/PurR family transcriptional regulator